MPARDDVAAVRLRAVTDDDIAVFYVQQLDPEACAMAAFPARSRDEHFAHWRKVLLDPANLHWTIDVDGAVAGNVVSWAQDGEREIGYWLGKEFWGRGIATAAVRLLVAEVTARPLFAWVAHGNPGSMRVLEKVGFTEDRDEDDHRVYALR